MTDVSMRGNLEPAKNQLPDDLLWEGRPKSFFVRNRVLLLRLGLFVLLMGSWQLFAGTPGEGLAFVDAYYVSKPSNVVMEVVRWIQGGQLWSNLWSTIQVTLVGFAIGAGLGIACGFLVGTNKLAAEVLNPFLAAFSSIPRLALMPLLLIWFGLGMASKVALVVLVCFILVFNNTFSGVREVSGDLISIVQLMGASRTQVYRMVVLPSAMVWVISGLRVSIPYALVGAVIAEMQSSNRGVGYLLVRAAGQFNIHGTFAAVVVIMIVAILLNIVVERVEARALVWKYAKR